MTAADRIYLDHNATSVLRPEAMAAMVAALRQAAMRHRFTVKAVRRAAALIWRVSR